MIHRKAVRILRSLGTCSRWALLSALVAILSLEAYALILTHTEGSASLPSTFGNFERVRSLLADDEKSEEFSFAVVGDTRGCGTFERICKKLKGMPLSFMVLLGDCVRKGTPGYHRYLRAEWADELATPFPVFYVAGNHDVDRKTFPISEFEKYYGPTNFSFDYHGCLFIVLRILDKPYSTEESFSFLESVLSDKRQSFERVFVFMHIPPPVSRDLPVREFENPKKLLALFDRFNVDYVIAGDYHGYARVKLKNTTYLVTGGGGAHLKSSRHGEFHHAVIIKVGPDFVSERILPADRTEDVEDRLELLALSAIYPWLENNRPGAVILNLAILLLCLRVIYGYFRNTRRSTAIKAS